MQEQSVVITGASSGIGKACALHLKKAGYCVFAGVRNSADGAALQRETAQITPLILDITNAQSIKSAIDKVADKKRGKLFGLVNNAGIALGGPLEILPVDEIRTLLEVNVLGAIAVTQAFVPFLRNNGRGALLISVPFRGASLFPV